ncbi:DNA polymerase III subunit delta' [Tahibacter amnicola]|uniref:DNA-directed DNA polymerase n=1 Tax=Tahibacter amnicola TaxID=2976241 RepID=A0ABY6BI17_9GAMM|nr:DNA polymerase III subunit delta' [Tahibacter amnicola]UXI69653.1 DNA polymerase III subunit delta' [Tahibacter amnicola]
MSAANWNAPLWNNVLDRLRRGAMPHALLLSGAAGLGKRAFADRLANLLLCENRADEPCGRCRGCLLYTAGSHPDRMQVTLELRDDGKLRTEIVVEQIRVLSERLALTPQFGGHQVALIDPADLMNTAAANALLKTLEEPSTGTVMVLVSDQSSRLPATIRSRCQRLDFLLPSPSEAIAWLNAQGISGAAQALEAAAGNPGVAAELARGGGLMLRTEVATDLGQLWHGKASAAEIANRWAKTEGERRLWFAAQLAEAEASAVARSQSGPLALTAPVDFNKLATWFREAGRVRELLRTPVRSELLLLELLIAWRELAPAARRA